MMKSSIVFFYSVLLLLSEQTWSQKSINQVDSIGYKQGFWSEIHVEALGDIHLIGYSDSDSSLTSPCGFIKDIYGNDCIARRYEGYYNNGLKTKKWTGYYPNGVISSKIEYKNGVPSGMCKFYHMNGNLKKKFYISNSQNIEVTLNNFDGTFFKKITSTKIHLIKTIYEE